MTKRLAVDRGIENECEFAEKCGDEIASHPAEVVRVYEPQEKGMFRFNLIITRGWKWSIEAQFFFWTPRFAAWAKTLLTAIGTRKVY